MKFILPQRDFIRLLKVVTDTKGLPKHQRDPHLRMEASNGTLFMSGNEAEASAPALVDVEGVCFLNYRRLLPLVRTFKADESLTIEVAPTGLRIGDFRGMEHAGLVGMPEVEQIPSFAPLVQGAEFGAE